MRSSCKYCQGPYNSNDGTPHHNIHTRYTKERKIEIAGFERDTYNRALSTEEEKEKEMSNVCKLGGLL